MKYLLLLFTIFTFSCSNEPVEFRLSTEDETTEPNDGDSIENPIEEIYATAKLDGQNFVGNQYQIDTLSSEKLKVSFFSELEQQIFLILPNPPSQGSYVITQNNDDMPLYSAAFINSVGNVSESIFYSMPDTGQIVINAVNNGDGYMKGSFEFDVATFNNNIIVVSEGEFEITP